MHAILFCNNHEALPPLFSAEREYAALPVLTRPLAWHMAEQCLLAGATRCTFVAASQPTNLRTLLGHGERWGVSIDVITPVSDNEATLRVLLASLPPGEMALVLPACWLCPPDALKALAAEAFSAKPPGVGTLAANPPGHAPHIRAGGGSGTARHAPPPLAVLDCDASGAMLLRSSGDVVRASMAALDGRLPWLTREEKERAPGIAVGHHAAIHPEAKLTPPVLVGAFASIEAGCVIGPHVVIGERCVVDREAELNRCVLDAETYVGAMTCHEDMLLIKRMVIHSLRETCLLLPDPALQDTLEQAPHDTLRRICHQLGGLALALLCAPLLLALWLWGGGFERRMVRGREESVSLDCFQSPTLLRIRETRRGPAALRRLPALLDVAEGSLALIGPEPFTPEAAEQLTQDWQRLRFGVTPGLIPPWAGLADAPINAEEKQSINAWYARNATLSTDRTVLTGLLRRGWGHGKAASK